MCRRFFIFILCIHSISILPPCHDTHKQQREREREKVRHWDVKTLKIARSHTQACHSNQSCYSFVLFFTALLVLPLRTFLTHPICSYFVFCCRSFWCVHVCAPCSFNFIRFALLHVMTFYWFVLWLFIRTVFALIHNISIWWVAASAESLSTVRRINVTESRDNIRYI